MSVGNKLSIDRACFLTKLLEHMHGRMSGVGVVINRPRGIINAHTDVAVVPGKVPEGVCVAWQSNTLVASFMDF